MTVDLVYAAYPYVIVTGCAEAVRAEFVELGDEPARFCPIVPGDIAWDECCNGQFAQTITRPAIYSQNGRDEQSFIGDLNFCGPFYIGFEVQASILRCAPTQSSTGKPPLCDALSASALKVQLDAARVRGGIICCLKERLANDLISSFRIVSQVPQGPEGGCVGSVLTYQVWLPNCDCPD